MTIVVGAVLGVLSTRNRCSVLKIEAGELLAVAQHDLALVVANEAEDASAVQVG